MSRQLKQPVFERGQALQGSDAGKLQDVIPGACPRNATLDILLLSAVGGGVGDELDVDDA